MNNIQRYLLKTIADVAMQALRCPPIKCDFTEEGHVMLVLDPDASEDPFWLAVRESVQKEPTE